MKRSSYKSSSSSSSLVFVVTFLVIVSVAFRVVSVEARKHHRSTNKRSNKPHSKHHRSSAPVPDHDGGSYNPTQSSIFDLLSFGAKGDGVSDDTKALGEAWKAACKVAGATVEIPSEFKFLINPITLQGPCMPNLVLQIDGTILAPAKVGSWPKSSLFQWINFKWLHNFTIQGDGIVDGQGSAWWANAAASPTNYSLQKKSKHIPDMKPTALRFYESYNVRVRGIKINNSPLCHLKFDSSGGIKVDNIHISSPENSPNTDGIHIQNTKDVEIHHSDIACGDDCVSIQTGCSNVHIHHINCGPGHGISLGGLGKDKSVACVSDIVVENISVQNTLSGVRIKTWQGGVGSVKNVTFSNIQVSDVKVPIIIDQFYCDNKRLCKNQTGAVGISGVEFNQVIGTYSVQPIHLACSNSVPCTDVDLIDIQLKPSAKFVGQSSTNYKQALCWNSYGKSQAPLVPSSIDYCLRRDHGGSVRRISRSHEHAC